MFEKQLIFCFPYRGAGGVSLLFLRLAKYLHQQGLNVSLIDYIDGYMAENIDVDINFIEYKDDEDVYLPEDSIIVFQAMTPWSIFPSLKIHPNTGVFFLATLPQNFYPLLPAIRDALSSGGLLAKITWKTILFDEYTKMRKFIALGSEHKSLAFLDYDIVANVEGNLNCAIVNPVLIPLFSEDVDENLYIKDVKPVEKIVNMGWVGRIADFKVHILNKVMKDARQYADQKDICIHFTIVGYGEKEAELSFVESGSFKVIRIDHISPNKLSDFLLGLDLYFAMGTSALDGARLGVPTVRLDYSLSKISEPYKYKFLNDVKGYSLGELINGYYYEQGRHDFSDLMRLVVNEKRALSTSIYDFYNSHHSLKESSRLLLKALEVSTLKWSDILKAKLMSSWLYSIWAKVRF